MDDLIDKQSAIAIAMCYCPDDDGSCSKADFDIRELLDEIENLPAVNRWIPCHERMPKTEGRYLVYDSVMKASFITQYFGDGKWCCLIAEITHWMPLPDDP